MPKIRLLVSNVRFPSTKHKKAKRGAVKKGTEIDVSKSLAKMLVGEKRAEYVEKKDKASGPIGSEILNKDK